MSRVGSILGLAISVVFLLASLIAIATPFHSDSSSAVGLLFISLLTMAGSLVAMRVRKKPVSIKEFRVRTGAQPFMKKCIECGKELPIASERCEYCETVQPEYGG